MLWCLHSLNSSLLRPAYVQVIDYSPITSMYGAVHCSSQVVRRLPKTQPNYNAGSSLTRQLRQASLGGNGQRPQ